MKKAKRIVVAALMMVCMVFALCSCGNANADGTYVIESMNGQNIDTILEQYKSLGVGDITAEQISKIVISGSNITVSSYGESDSTGTVEVSGSTLKMTVDGDTQEATLSDGKLTMSAGGTTLVYKKK